MSRDPEARTVLRLNENHWAAEKPEVTEIVSTPIKEAGTRVAALLSGEVAFVPDVRVQDIARLQGTVGINVTTGAENRTIFFACDMGSENLRAASVPGNPFKNPAVRAAMALALDRNAISRVVVRGQSVPGAQNARPFVNGWRAELDVYGPLVSGVLAFVFGVALEVYTALNRRGWLSNRIMTVSLIGVSLPTFRFGILLIWVFAVKLTWLPAFGRGETVEIGGWTTRVPDAFRAGLARPAGDHPRALPDDADHAARPGRDARGAARRLHQVRARGSCRTAPSTSGMRSRIRSSP